MEGLHRMRIRRKAKTNYCIPVKELFFSAILAFIVKPPEFIIKA